MSFGYDRKSIRVLPKENSPKALVCQENTAYVLVHYNVSQDHNLIVTSEVAKRKSAGFQDYSHTAK